MPRDRVLVRGLRVEAILGIEPRERTTPQEVVIDLVIHTDVTAAALTGDLERSVNYAAVAERAAQLTREGDYHLAETLAHELARMIVTEFGAARVVVRVEKPHAVPGAAAVGVEVDREAADFA